MESIQDCGSQEEEPEEDGRHVEKIEEEDGSEEAEAENDNQRQWSRRGLAADEYEEEIAQSEVSSK